MSKKNICNIFIMVLLAGSVWAGEPAKATEQEIALPAIKISKTTKETETQRCAAFGKDTVTADKNKMSVEANVVTAQPL